VADLVARHDPGGVLYGAVVTAGTLAAVSANVSHVRRVALAVAVVLVAYWLAHVYVATQQMLFDGSSRSLLGRIRTAAREEATVLVGGLPAVLVYLAAYWLLGAEARTAALGALWFSVGFLFLIGYLGAHRAGMRGAALLVESCGAGSLGILAVVAKLLLH
jgi:hypothetical protein